MSRPIDNDLSRLKTLCKAVYYILTILTAGLIVLIALMALAFIVETLEPGTITGGEDPVAMSTVAVMAFMFVIAAMIVVMLRNIAKSIYREYSPFTRTNVRRFELISIVCLLPIATIPLIYIDTSMTVIDIASIVIGSLLASATIYILALVFRYGSWLQKESDETL